MAMHVEKAKLIINVPNSEAKKECQLIGIKDRDVTGYYTNDDQNKKNEIIDFFDNFNMEFYISSNKTIEYYKKIKDKVFIYKDAFKNDLSFIDQCIEKFKEKDVKIPKLYFNGGTNEGRYLKFDNYNEIVDAFRCLILGDISNIVIEKNKECYYIYPELKDNYFTILSKKIKEITDNNLSRMLEMYCKNDDYDNSIVFNLFGYDFYDELCDLTNGTINDKKIMDIIDRSTVYFDNLDKKPILIQIKQGVRLRMLTKNNNSIDDSVEVNTPKFNDNGIIGYNKIYYGIPGCGKSYHIEHVVLKETDKKNDVFRTTFYSDYSNTDFVGQIYPVVKDKDVSYEYIPGPFTKALERALTVDDGRMIYLVIEEINRGNAAAIFGDLFQLLDRLDKDLDGRRRGDSEYPISNQFIEGYFHRKNSSGSSIPFEDGNIYIPRNLTILATMNSSDQNVYTLDTAFQRRWDREQVISNIKDSKYSKLFVPNTNITWESFASKVNFHMINDCEDGSITEDKNLGAYFVTKDMLCTGNETPSEVKEKAMRFSNNVLEYLFNTAVKFEKEVLFDEKYNRYQLIYDEISSFDMSQDESLHFISLLSKKLADDLKEDIV